MLAPEIVDRILAGKADQALMLERLEKPLPMSWDEQRRQLVLSRKGMPNLIRAPLTRATVAP